MTLLSALSLVACAGTPTPAPVIAAAPAPSPSVTLPVTAERPAGSALEVTRVGHASVLLSFGDQIVLTDPWFTESSQYHHGEPIAVDVAGLPELAAVVVSHEHYDHFDIDAFAAYRDKAVPMVVAPGLAKRVRAAGFTDVRELSDWESTEVGGLHFTAAPGSHGVPEQTFVIEGAGYTVYFAGDTRRVPALDEIASRFPKIDLALLPVNGLRILPMLGHQVVMSAEDAGELCSVLRPAVAVPIHYRFRGGWLTEPLVLAYDGTPERFVEAARIEAPQTVTRVLDPGQPLALVAE